VNPATGNLGEEARGQRNLTKGHIATRTNCANIYNETFDLNDVKFTQLAHYYTPRLRVVIDIYLHVAI